MVRTRKPDIMTLLVIAVVVGVITTTTVQAYETDELSHIIGMSSCITLSGQAPACVTLNTMVNSRFSNSLSLSGVESEFSRSESAMKQTKSLERVSFVSFKEGRCAYSASFNGQQSASPEEITEMSFDLNNHLGLDVGMKGDFIGVSVSSVYLGFKDCW